MSQPGWYPVEPAQPRQGPVLDTKIGRKQLHADPQVITYGKKSIALDEVEWVSYTATHTATKRFMYPTTHHSEWHFNVGTYPYNGSAAVAVNEFRAGRREDPPEFWTFLVNLSQQYVEPRLLTELVDRVRRGETVLVGGALRVSLEGIACIRPKFSLPWESCGGAKAYNGAVWIYQAGVEKPLTAASLSNPNAGLIPALFAMLTS
jgi:hypothetical protein